MAFAPTLPVTAPRQFQGRCTRRPRVIRRTCTCRNKRPFRAEADYAGWSADFLELCRAQLDLLASSVADVTQAALFFRQEDTRSGALEFVPLAVADNTRRVWIAHGSGTAKLETPPSNFLPGGVPAVYLLPSYPAVDEDDAMELPDGGLCVPVEYNNAVAGSVVLWRFGAVRPWSGTDIARARAVARSIAIAAALDGKTAARGRAADHAAELLGNARNALGTATHQMRSAISALVTFGHVLLRRLEPGNPLRTLAKSIVVEARRLDDLLVPLDQVKTGLITEGSVRPIDVEKDDKSEEETVKLLEIDKGWNDEIGRLVKIDAMRDRNDEKVHVETDMRDTNVEEMNDSKYEALFDEYEASFELEDEVDDFEDDDDEEADAEEEKDRIARLAWEYAIADNDWMNPEDDGWIVPDENDDGQIDTSASTDVTQLELVWLSDLAEPVASTAAVLASEAGVTFTSYIDGDAPATMANADDVREAMYNLVSNALRYTQRGGHMGLVVVGTTIVVWDTGVGVEKEEARTIWDAGVRGSNAANVRGDGIGLAVARDAVCNAGGNVAVRSPIPGKLDPRPELMRDTPGTLFCARFPRAAV